MHTAAVIRVGGVCALMGVVAGLAGAVVGAIHGLGGQEIPLAAATDFQKLLERRAPYVLREWLFLAYAVLVVGEGVGLYFLTRAAPTIALWALVAFSVGIIVAIVQDATMVALVTHLPVEYAAADAPTRLTLEAGARTTTAGIAVQQSVANVLLGIGVALYSVAVLRTSVASKWFALFGFLAAIATVFYAFVTATGPRFAELESIAEHAFGLAVVWDLWTAVILLTHRGHPSLQGDHSGKL